MAKRSKAGKGYQGRVFATREVRQRFLIVCEGEKTEKLYFQGFRAPGLVVQVEGIGKDPTAVIERADYLRQQGEYDQVWCVFDRDEVTAVAFNQALAQARRLKICVAYSNPAFELWYLLHFHYCDTPISRADYLTRLSQCLGRSYQKNDHTVYGALLPRQDEALRHAVTLLKQYEPSRPAEDDPSTKVHELVLALNRYGRLHHT